MTTYPADPTEPARWWVYRGTGRPSSPPPELPPAPPWRSFSGQPSAGKNQLSGHPDPDIEEAENDRRLGHYRLTVAYEAGDEEKNLVNLALHLRRPLLVTGQPGVGKSTLAYSVAYELGLGKVLHWPITSRSTLLQGLYQYDAIGRLQEVSFQREVAAAAAAKDRSAPEDMAAPEIGRYLRLGPLGTALLPRWRPRVLLIDEIDKSDIDLPNDLLNVFEEGEFVIPELARLRTEKITVMTSDDGRAELKSGLVRCREFPFIVMTSNSERAFPQAFIRRCVRLEIKNPKEKGLARLVAAHLNPAGDDRTISEDLIREFIRKQNDEGAVLANDQLLNALLMATAGLWTSNDGRRLIDEHLLRSLNQTET